MTTSYQLTEWMQQHDPSYIGTFSLNTVPSSPSNSFSFIVNTHTENLPGQHWIAVRGISDEAWIFDPLALPPPFALCNHLLLHCHMNKLYCCKTQVQPSFTQTCGHHCVFFLLTNSAASSESVVTSFVKNL
jgi:hypothetical protein